MNDSPKDNGVRKVEECRMCGETRLSLFFDLGMQPLANSLLANERSAAEEPRYPLGLLFCEACKLVQLSHVIDPKLLFPDTYVYHSSGIPSSPHFTRYAGEVRDRFFCNSGTFVVEIGSNDGHLLRLIKDFGARVQGVDPASEVARHAREKGVPTLVEFFSEGLAKK